jgi:hypothetical protein
MTSKRPRKHLDQKLKYVGLPHWMLTCAAWKALPLAAKVLYIEGLELRFNGSNNGDIRLSQIEAAKVIGSTGRGVCTHQQAANMLQRLADLGFIKPVVKGRFHVKTRFATRWLLTRYEREGKNPTMDFMQLSSELVANLVTIAVAREREKKIKRRVPTGNNTCAPTEPDAADEAQSGAHREPDSPIPPAPTCAPREQVLVYQGERSTRTPKGTQRAKAAWLRAHLDSGVVTPDAVASALAIPPNNVPEIAAGKIALASTSWQKVARLVAARMN